MHELQGLFFWGFLVVFGSVMYLLSPRARDPEGFFSGRDHAGRQASLWALTMSVFISWIFAKSVTNAANLGEQYGIVGGLAYACYWLGIPFAGLVIYRLRVKYGATGLVAFLSARYGAAAALAFSAAILIRLYNEVWSNTAVIGGYFGTPGSAPFIAAALLTTAIVLMYSIKGGLRSAIFTDIVQAGVFLVALCIVVAYVVPAADAGDLIAEGHWKLDAGLDLLLVALLQIMSYPFHDPVLTDRGFITPARTMLRAFVVAGLLGFLAILTFSLIGVQARLQGLPPTANVPAEVARGLGLAGAFAMMAVMVSSAASTLDSTFASLAKTVGRELPALAGRSFGSRSVKVGVLAMVVVAVLGNLPMIAGTDILKATTLSGTMVIGLAPVFVLGGWVQYSPLSFHLSYWTGMTLGILLTLGRMPDGWAIGTGKYALLLGTNLYGLLLCTAAFLLPVALNERQWRRGEESA